MPIVDPRSVILKKVSMRPVAAGAVVEVCAMAHRVADVCVPYVSVYEW